LKNCFTSLGSVIHNIELKPGKGGHIARSAASYARLLGKIDKNKYLLEILMSISSVG